MSQKSFQSLRAGIFLEEMRKLLDKLIENLRVAPRRPAYSRGIVENDNAEHQGNREIRTPRPVVQQRRSAQSRHRGRMRRRHTAGFSRTPNYQSLLGEKNHQHLEKLGTHHGQERGKQERIGQHNSFLGSFIPLLPCILVILLRGIVSADDGKLSGTPRNRQPPIISQGAVTIQVLSLTEFSSWPGIGTSPPIDIRAAAGRIIAVWPKRLISLNSRGRADRATLLALFATASAPWINGEWTPENGLLCTDGIWRAPVPGFGLYELNLSTGSVNRRTEPRLIPGSLHPGPQGSTLIRGTHASMIIPARGELTILPAVAPKTPLIAVSSTLPNPPKIAWISPEDGALHAGALRIDPSSLGGDVNWSMDWWGRSLAVGRSGYVLVLTPGGGEEGDNLHPVHRIEDPRIPSRWYRVRGDENRLILHTPGLPEALIITRASPDSLLSPDISPSTGQSFPELLKTHVLDAGLHLEAEGRESAAESFYGWSLPLIRENRSRRPLDPAWARLEREITARRSRLREKL